MENIRWKYVICFLFLLCSELWVLVEAAYVAVCGVETSDIMYMYTHVNPSFTI